MGVHLEKSVGEVSGKREYKWQITVVDGVST